MMSTEIMVQVVLVPNFPRWLPRWLQRRWSKVEMRAISSSSSLVWTSDLGWPEGITKDNTRMSASILWYGKLQADRKRTAKFTPTET